MKKAAIAISLLMFPLIAGCQTVQDLTSLTSPVFNLQNIRPHVNVALPLNASSIDFDIAIRVDNPNNLRLQLDRVDFDLLANGNHLLRSASSNRINIPAQGSGDLRIQTRVGYNEVLSGWRTAVDLVTGQQPSYEMRGRAYYRTPIGVIDFPFTVSRTSF